MKEEEARWRLGPKELTAGYVPLGRKSYSVSGILLLSNYAVLESWVDKLHFLCCGSRVLSNSVHFSAFFSILFRRPLSVLRETSPAPFTCKGCLRERQKLSFYGDCEIKIAIKSRTVFRAP
jgi:hypothetical protein